MIEDTFQSGWNACKQFIVKLIEEESANWLPNGPSRGTADAIRKRIAEKAVLVSGQDNSFHLPCIKPREKSSENKSGNGKSPSVERLNTTPQSGTGAPPTNSQTKTKAEVDRFRSIVDILPLSSALDGTWSEKWRRIQEEARKESRGFS